MAIRPYGSVKATRFLAPFVEPCINLAFII